MAYFENENPIISKPSVKITIIIFKLTGISGGIFSTYTALFSFRLLLFLEELSSALSVLASQQLSLAINSLHSPKLHPVV